MSALQDQLDERMADQMREPLVAALIRFLDAVNEDPEARRARLRVMDITELVCQAMDNVT